MQKRSYMMLKVSEVDSVTNTSIEWNCFLPCLEIIRAKVRMRTRNAKVKNVNTIQYRLWAHIEHLSELLIGLQQNSRPHNVTLLFYLHLLRLCFVNNIRIWVRFNSCQISFFFLGRTLWWCSHIKFCIWRAV